MKANNILAAALLFLAGFFVAYMVGINTGREKERETARADYEFINEQYQLCLAYVYECEPSVIDDALVGSDYWQDLMFYNNDFEIFAQAILDDEY